MKMLQLKGGSTDVSVPIRIIDSTTFLPETGVDKDTAGLALWYWRQGGTVTALTEANLAALNSAHSDGGMFEASDGYYRVDIPDAAFAAGADWVLIGGTVTGMVVEGVLVQLMGYDPKSNIQGPYGTYPDP